MMVKVWAFDVPPPGVGLKTVTLADPADAMSEARMDALSWVEETYVVVRSDPFHRTVDNGTKLFPFTVRVNAAPPAVAEVGERLVVTGAGLVAGLMVKVWVLEVPPPGVGLKTVTAAVPADAISEMEMDAVSWLAET